jgi:pantoate--beta-alanine ligase
MKIFNHISEMREFLDTCKDGAIGFVPTMGYLHQGHLSLVKECKRLNRYGIVSIYVNPAQFSPNEDLDQYPRDLDRDLKMLEELGVDAVFVPDTSVIYPDGFSTYVSVEGLGDHLCGKSRPTHFRGVTTVVLKLFNIIKPHRAYFGQKDAQQAVIIKKMVRDLDLDVDVKALPIVRDTDGLALSSRNAYLSPEERQAGLALSRALNAGKALINEGETKTAHIKAKMLEVLEKETLLKVDYIEIVDLKRLVPIESVIPESTLVAGAVFAGKTRLIDNFVLGEI